MDTFIIKGGNPLHGKVSVSGAKNAALKALVAACLTDEAVIIENFPLISDLHVMVEIIELLQGTVILKDHRVIIKADKLTSYKIPIAISARVRTSILFLAPLLARVKEAIIPNPGGDKIGSRPIERITKGLKKMNAEILYNKEDGYFYAKTKGLIGTEYTFEKNTHTGTETLILAAVLAKGTTVLKNAAEEPEVDELIALLKSMGAKIQRSNKREITIVGVKKLHGTAITILPDRNEIVTFAIGAYVTKGDVTVRDATKVDLVAFLHELDKAGGQYEIHGNDIRFFATKQLKSTDVTTSIYPGFMTDWQAPWALLMTQAHGTSTMHETVFEYRFGYVKELKKMGAHIEMYNPRVKNLERIYNFNLQDDKSNFFRAIKITGPTQLEHAVMTICDLRAGATLVLAALAGKGETTIYGLEQVDRGYEEFEKRLASLGADIQRIYTA